MVLTVAAVYLYLPSTINVTTRYVVDVDRTGTSPDRNPNITILDSDTGTDQANSERDEALHQFYNSNMAASYPCKA